MHRRIGVSILGWFAIVWGALAVAVGVLGVFLGLYATAVGGVALNSGLTGGAGSFALGLVVVALSAVGAVVGLGDVIFGVGILRLSGWAWVMGHVLMIATIVLNIVGALEVRSGVISSLLGIVLAGGILYYLHRPEVLAAFRRGTASEARQSATPPSDPAHTPTAAGPSAPPSR